MCNERAANVQVKRQLSADRPSLYLFPFLLFLPFPLSLSLNCHATQTEGPTRT